PLLFRTAVISWSRFGPHVLLARTVALLGPRSTCKGIGNLAWLQDKMAVSIPMHFRSCPESEVRKRTSAQVTRLFGGGQAPSTGGARGASRARTPARAAIGGCMLSSNV